MTKHILKTGEKGEEAEMDQKWFYSETGGVSTSLYICVHLMCMNGGTGGIQDFPLRI